jgi:2-methylisocitrate lyase-like PEP mutase family enzyme
VTTAAEKAARFLALHEAGDILLMPNAWDRGSARILTALGFPALATTSSGFAVSLGLLDGQVTLDDALAHSADMADATDVPVSADLEHGFADDPAAVAETYARAAATGLAGGSIEDSTGRQEDPIYAAALAAERVVAAAEAAHVGPVRLVLTARAENHLYGIRDLADTIARLQSYQEAGADVLFAPGWSDPGDIRSIVTSVDLPVSVLLRRGGPTVAELAELGVRRISVGGSFAYVAYGALIEAGRELLETGTTGYTERSRVANDFIRQAFS